MKIHCKKSQNFRVANFHELGEGMQIGSMNLKGPKRLEYYLLCQLSIQMPLNSKSTLLCLLCDNRNVLCTYFSFASWRTVRCSQQRALEGSAVPLSPGSCAVQLSQDSRFLQPTRGQQLPSAPPLAASQWTVGYFLQKGHPVSDLLDTLSGDFAGIPRPSTSLQTASSRDIH